jgi:hypothetical protein
MNERKDLFIAMLIFVTASAPVSAQERRVSKQSPLSIHRVDLKPGSWCLHDYENDSINCSFVTGNQCAATASGGLGECVRKRRRHSTSNLGIGKLP